MDKEDFDYLKNAFADLINYSADDPVKPVDPLTYLTPEGDSCLHYAVLRGDFRAVKLLVDAGLDVNLRGDLGSTPLHYARMTSHQNIKDIEDFLISHGAKLDVINELGQYASDRLPLKSLDAKGNTITVGDRVLFMRAPETLLSGLPLEDQEAIKTQEGKTMEIVGFDSYGHAEMEFTAENGTIHTIWVEPAKLFKV